MRYYYGTGNRREWKWPMRLGGNRNKTWLSLGTGMGIGMNHCEREGVGLKKIFPLISNLHHHTRS